MSDLVWVAFISAGGALLASVMTQFLAMRAAAKQAARTAQQETLQWQRTEAKRMRELHEARLREFWAHVLNAQNRIRDALENRPANVNSALPTASESAASASAQAYAVALIGLPGVRALAKDFYLATASAEMVILYREEMHDEPVRAWRDCLSALETAVAEESAVFQTPA